jgi:hypothetical protein
MAAKQKQIALLVAMSLIGFACGVWLFRAGLILLGCVYMALWLWNAHRFAILLSLPIDPSDRAIGSPPMSRGQRVLLALLSLAAAAVSAIGVYIWYISPPDWQAGLVFILFGLIGLIPVTISELRPAFLRKRNEQQ